ncbi:hypothetical protein AeRB84_006200 [Aphanomyces euteiches]|nr:hypothetical protein AeRB84_006681 [Aphanomyces euteiches]KAH9151117.1 hypothetical protein AeRB84_006200 [Aphanomyces euteiches]
MVLDIVRNLETREWIIDYRGLEITHNHAPSTTPSSHPVHRRADRDLFVLDAIKTDGEIGIRADQTLARLSTERPDLSIIPRDIYHERQRSLRENLNGRSRIEHLLHLLESPDYTSAVQQDELGRVTHLFFAFNETLEIFALNHDVIIMDCTYKTNGFGMPLFNIIGVSGSNATLHVAQVFLRGETEVDFYWAHMPIEFSAVEV